MISTIYKRSLERVPLSMMMASDGELCLKPEGSAGLKPANGGSLASHILLGGFLAGRCSIGAGGSIADGAITMDFRDCQLLCSG